MIRTAHVVRVAAPVENEVGPTRKRLTLVEAVIVVAILLTSGTVAAVVLDRIIVRARTAEAKALLVDIASRELAYAAANNSFVPLRVDVRAHDAPPDEDPAGFYPVPADSPALAPARVAARVDDPARLPESWRIIGVRPRGGHVYCTYLANAGDGPVPSSLRFGSALLAGAPPGPWFYALAACNLAGNPGYPNEVTVFGVSSLSSEIRTFNPGR